MAAARRRSLTPARLASAAAGVLVIWLTVLAFTVANPVDLSVALLVVLAEVLLVAVLAGPVLSVVAALASVVLVNWYLVPPYGTFEVASPDNVVALVVFTLVAVVAATLMEVGARARTRAAESERQTELLADVVTVSDEDDTARALERVRTGLGLDYLELRAMGAGRVDVLLASAGTASGRPSLDIDLPEGYRLVGQGNELLAPDPDFLVSLGSAAVRAYESEQLQAETARADELAAIDRARTALLASVGHDLRTPLASLRIGVEGLQSPALGEDDRRTLLATLAASTDRLDDLISNLLDMSRLQAGAIPVHLQPTELADVVDSVELAFTNPRLAIDLPRNLPQVAADAALLERILVNLTSNALRYSPEGQPVRISATALADAVDLQVTDSGPGIAAADAESVFAPFHRVGAQPDGGSGLGLAIVRGFAEAMGMGISLEERPGGGLVARLTMRTWEEPA